MNSAVTLVDFDRLLNGLDHIYSEFSRACGLSDCAYWMLVDECETFKQQVAAESQMQDRREGESCDC